MAVFRLIQTPLAWQDPEANRKALADKVAGHAGSLNILPEMFTTGFSMASATHAEPAEGPTAAWLRSLAQDRGVSICGSVMVEDNGYYNRFMLAQHAGGFQHYDKRHLFRMAGEHEHYSPGNERLIFQHQEMRVLAQICYDLRFPVYCRNRNDYDVLLFVANWPEARREHWLALLKARAIENLCYVVGVNRIGKDGNDVSYSGDSCVIDYRGETLLDLGRSDTCKDIELDLLSLREYRQTFPAWQDADDFVLKDT